MAYKKCDYSHCWWNSAQVIIISDACSNALVTLDANLIAKTLWPLFKKRINWDLETNPTCFNDDISFDVDLSSMDKTAYKLPTTKYLEIFGDSDLNWMQRYQQKSKFLSEGWN